MNLAIKRVKNGFVIEKGGQYGGWDTEEVCTTLGQTIESIITRFCTDIDNETGDERVDEEQLQRVLQDLVYWVSNRVEQKKKETKEEK